MSEPLQHSVRFSVEAKQNVIGIGHAFMKKSGDVRAASALIDFFYDEAGKLAVFPDALRIHEEESAFLDCEVRRLLVRSGSRSWNLSYRIENEDDGPQVWILCIRDARVPLSQEEAEGIMRNQ